ncbi:MAG TPA: endonuclease/exonuclease/phosphatase family protein [Planctomycetota bacterium]|nr:endonuclease/exonuclease/phosphatase family protein [Planctomycetota bacterium]
MPGPPPEGDDGAVASAPPAAASPVAPTPNALPRRRGRRILLRVLAVVVGAPSLLAALFVFNGLVLASGETPRLGELAHAGEPPPASGREVTIVAYNIAKAWAHRSGLRFASREKVRRTLDEMGALVAEQKPDLVFLSEALKECGPCEVDQVRAIADKAGLRYWAFGENYNVGIPFFRIAGGNAILSRFPLRGVSNLPLPGRKPFWVTTNNRRFLLCEADVGGRPLLLGAMHTDSFSVRNNARHTARILELTAGRDLLLAGDYNARPHESSMLAIKASGRFVGAMEGPWTHKTYGRTSRIDYVLAPPGWTHLETQVIENDVSDHRPVVARFRVP